MPNIVGQFKAASSTMPPLDAHISHLRHLTNVKVTRELLRSAFKHPASYASDNSKIIAAHVDQALQFYGQSRDACMEVRPVLQYYCHLNLAVAVIIAYQPPNANQYRRHGVEDSTYALDKLDLASYLLKVKTGAVPLFHSVISDAPIEGRRFRLGQLIAGFPMVHHELESRFGKETESIYINEDTNEVSGSWWSDYYFTYGGSIEGRPSERRLEAAMPILKAEYRKLKPNNRQTKYRSRSNWSTKKAATRNHRQNGIKIINFGGQWIVDPLIGGEVHSAYSWHGVRRVLLLPTLTSILLLSFSLASVSRYRPLLLRNAMASPIHLLLDTFISEVDSVFIPALRCLLYREESVIGRIKYL